MTEVAEFLAALEGLAREVGDDVVLEACRRYLTDPQRGFEAALRHVLDREGWPAPVGLAGWPTPGHRRQP